MSLHPWRLDTGHVICRREGGLKTDSIGQPEASDTLMRGIVRQEPTMTQVSADGCTAAIS